MIVCMRVFIPSFYLLTTVNSSTTNTLDDIDIFVNGLPKVK